MTGSAEESYDDWRRGAYPGAETHYSPDTTVG